jgi:Subtilase family
VGHFFSCFFFAGSFLLCLLSPCANAGQATIKSDRQPTQADTLGVRLSFQGGVAGYKLAEVLTTVFQDHPESLKLQSYQIGNSSICGLLQNLNYPPPCDAYYPLIDRINKSSVSKKNLQNEDLVALPSLPIVSDKSIRVFSKLDKGEVVQGNELLRNWHDLGAQRIEAADSFAIKFVTYDLVVPATDDESANVLFEDLVKYRSPNLLINLLTNTINPNPKLHFYFPGSAFPDQGDLKTDCASGALKTRSLEGLPLFRYRELMNGDQDALSLMKAGLTTSPASVTVTLIDTVLDPDQQDMPPSAVSSWSCAWSNFIGSKHHANHLRGIIGSVGPLHLFEGMSDHVSVQGYSWWKPADDHPEKLAKGSTDRGAELAGIFFDSFSASLPIPVFLAATYFEGYSKQAQNPSGQLAGPEKRFGRQPEQSIQKARPLLIVSAGQPDEENSEENDNIPVALSPTDPHSPQNLGDLENVVVVTACKVCGGASPKLLDKANFSAAHQHMVHIAAPGADPVVGWIDGASLSAAAGTSQSAALVAGLAASMIGQFPNVYVSGHVVKTRLQATSRPISPLPDGTPNPDATKLAAGIVDPVLALLDPGKHWLKQGGKWKNVTIRKWSTDNLSIGTPSGQGTVSFKTSAVLRVVKTHNADDALQTVYTIYVDPLKAEADDSMPGAAMDRYDFVSKLGNTALVLCDGSNIPLSKTEDLLISVSGVTKNECK